MNQNKGKNKNRPLQDHQNFRSIFSFKPKPISYIKGDIAYLPELNEDYLLSSKKGGNEILPIESMRNNKVDYLKSIRNIKKCPNDNIVFISPFKEEKLSNATTHKININLNTSEPVTSLGSKHHYSNNKINNISKFAGPPISCCESKSQREEEGKDHFINGDFGEGSKRLSTKHMLPFIFVIGTNQENNNNDFIYSWSKFHPFSFLTGVSKFGKNKISGLLNYPSPTFLNTKDWQKKPDLSKKAILNGMVVDDKDGLILVDEEIMKKFRGLISDMIKQILKAAFGTPISLKVQMFEPKSTLHRITDYWSFAPEFLNKAALAKTSIQRMKLVIAFAIAGFYIPTKQLKPFNPLIGETFQGEFENGGKIYVEHISHYPTVARFLIIDENFRFYGYFDFTTDTERFGSKINVHQKGPQTIEFLKTKEKIIYNMPTIKLLNASSEVGRSAIWINTMVFSDIPNNLKTIIKFGTNKNYIHGFEGYIIENQFPNTTYDHMKEVSIANDSKLEYDNKKTKNKIISKISGSWLKELRFDDKEVLWNVDNDIPNWIRPLTNVLPSDGRFREDLIWLFRSFQTKNEVERKKFQDLSQGWKITIEQTQRSEREIRKKNRPKKNN